MQVAFIKSSFRLPASEKEIIVNTEGTLSPSPSLNSVLIQTDGELMLFDHCLSDPLELYSEFTDNTADPLCYATILTAQTLFDVITRRSTAFQYQHQEKNQVINALYGSNTGKTQDHADIGFYDVALVASEKGEIFFFHVPTGILLLRTIFCRGLLVGIHVTPPSISPSSLILIYHNGIIVSVSVPSLLMELTASLAWNKVIIQYLRPQYALSHPHIPLHNPPSAKLTNFPINTSIKHSSHGFKYIDGLNDVITIASSFNGNPQNCWYLYDQSQLTRSRKTIGFPSTRPSNQFTPPQAGSPSLSESALIQNSETHVYFRFTTLGKKPFISQSQSDTNIPPVPLFKAFKKSVGSVFKLGMGLFSSKNKDDDDDDDTTNSSGQYTNSSKIKLQNHNEASMPQFLSIDHRREGVSLTLSPCSRYAAVTDTIGRVLLLDAETNIIIHVWKGVRNAQVAWLRERVHVRRNPKVALLKEKRFGVHKIRNIMDKQDRDEQKQQQETKSNQERKQYNLRSTDKLQELQLQQMQDQINILQEQVPGSSFEYITFLVIYASVIGIMEVFMIPNCTRVGSLSVGCSGVLLAPLMPLVSAAPYSPNQQCTSSKQFISQDQEPIPLIISPNIQSKYSYSSLGISPSPSLQSFQGQQYLPISQSYIHPIGDYVHQVGFMAENGMIFNVHVSVGQSFKIYLTEEQQKIVNSAQKSDVHHSSSNGILSKSDSQTRNLRSRSITSQKDLNPDQQQNSQTTPNHNPISFIQSIGNSPLLLSSKETYNINPFQRKNEQQKNE